MTLRSILRPQEGFKVQLEPIGKFSLKKNSQKLEINAQFLISVHMYSKVV